MIKLFRRIRQQLVNESKFSKYLLYAIGEILLVVFGILIALNLNTRKEIKTNSAQVEKILTNVFKDLEKDLVDNINSQISLYEIKDSLSRNVLSKTLKVADYMANITGNYSYSSLIEHQVEPYRFETNAYQRLVDNIEIVPEKYIHIVDKLQDVYGDEAVVTNDVVIEEKVFLENIQDRYQNNHDWYSETEDSNFDDKVNYLLNDNQHFNDIKRSQKITRHLLQHLNNLQQKATYAYNLIHHELSLNSEKSEQIANIEFLTFEELKVYSGTYKDETSGRVIEISPDLYTLNIMDIGIAYKVGKDKFKLLNASELTLEFTRNAYKEIISLLIKVRDLKNKDSNMTLKWIKIE